MTKLLRCPFCGNTEIGVGYNDKELGSSKWRAVCYNCGAHGPYENTSQEAIEAWNRRTERTAKAIEHDASVTNTDGYKYHRSEYLCGECKKKIFSGDDYCSHCGARLEWK